MDGADQFFNDLKRRGQEPMLRRVTGTVRFDLDHDRQTDHWLVTVAKGTISVSRRHRPADTVIHTDRALFERVVTGQANATAAIVRGLIGCTGNTELAALARRLFATTPASSPGGGHG